VRAIDRGQFDAVAVIDVAVQHRVLPGQLAAADLAGGNRLGGQQELGHRAILG